MDLSSQQLSFLKKEADPTLNWVRESIAVNKGLGSSAFFSRIRYPMKGWAPPYPETTGYLIPTLLQYQEILKDPLLLSQAKLCGEWLLSIQSKEGWFPALYQDSGIPSLFNTGMILFGLEGMFAKTGEDRYLKVIEIAVHWMANFAKENDWKETKSVNRSTYYVRALWGLTLANQVVKDETLNEFCVLSLRSFSESIQADGWINNWAFEGYASAFTHTMAYTWRGFLETSHLLKEDIVFESARRSFKIFTDKVGHPENIAGAYKGGFEKDGSFHCLPGLFQLSIVSFRFYELTCDFHFLNWGILCFEKGMTMRTPGWYGKEGGIFGSYPAMGKYMRFKQPNWGAKFYLDALELYVKYKEELP
ncbi:MAG: hypothetical protein KDC24_06355 [Saprospiraceae bacterium]|nr:hypothetical protein [Saprospiraceae bacterium]